MPSVLVTGTARGIGRATALRLAAAGWDVVAGVRRAEDGEGLRAEVTGRIAPVVLDVTVVGQVAVTQAVLPRLRASRGRVVFVSSLSGRVATPMTGAYNASKFALEAVADSLRLELRPWGVRVIVIEPAQTDTDMWRKADSTLDEEVAALSPVHRELYAKHIEGFRRTIPRSQRMASPVEGVAATIERALTARRPRARYVVGAGPRVQGILAELT